MHHIAAWGVSYVSGISVRTHRGDFAVGSSPIETDTVTGNPHFVHFLNDRVISPYSVAVRPHLKPCSSLVVYGVLWATINVDSISISSEVEFLYGLEDIHLYLQATSAYSSRVTPEESMTTIAW